MFHPSVDRGQELGMSEILIRKPVMVDAKLLDLNRHLWNFGGKISY